MRIEPRQLVRIPAAAMKTNRRTHPRFEVIVALAGPCVACGGVGEHRHHGLVLCRECREAGRPHVDRDPYDDLGGGD